MQQSEVFRETDSFVLTKGKRQATNAWNWRWFAIKATSISSIARKQLKSLLLVAGAEITDLLPERQTFWV